MKQSKTVFLPLPRHLWRPINGGCQCAYCKAHPELEPSWDTLASDPKTRLTWTVHFPELLTKEHAQ